MSRVFWDTNLFIYLLEDYGPHSEGVAELLAKMEVRGDQLLTSAITLGEVLVQPCSLGDLSRCRDYEAAIHSTAIILPFDAAASLSYARIRSQPRKINPPDAIQLACAAAAGVDLFLTSDARLHGVHVDGIHFITSVDRAPL
jgi:predicted nucleic acid-binding protein